MQGRASESGARLYAQERFGIRVILGRREDKLVEIVSRKAGEDDGAHGPVARKLAEAVTRIV